MSNKNQSWLNCLDINPGLVMEGIEFATPLDRCRYGGTSRWDRPQWLKDHPGVWRRVEDVLREAASRRCAEIPAEAAAAGPSCQIQPDMLKDDKDAGGSPSAAVPEADPLPADPTALTMEGFKTPPPPSKSDFEDEIAIGSRRYVSADRFASIRGISRRTLSRRIKAGEVPSQITIGKKLYFEVSALDSPAPDEFEQALPPNNEVR
jgi:predicted DNA-binding transcriptional regulator AlpA